MSQEKHTPLKVGNHFKSAVLNSENKMIADCKTPEIAELIVKACNNHDRLVEALEEARDVLVLTSLIDNSKHSKEQVEKIDQLLTKLQEDK